MSSSISANRASSSVAGGQLVPLGRQRLVERRAHLVERAGEVAAAPGALAHLPDLPAQPVEPAATVDAAAHELPQRVAQAAAVQHVAADLVERGPDVVRRSQRVGTTGPRAVPDPPTVARPATAGSDRQPSGRRLPSRQAP